MNDINDYNIYNYILYSFIAFICLYNIEKKMKIANADNI